MLPVSPTPPPRFLGWGTGFLDYDIDGLLDLFCANGHVYPGVDKQDWGTTPGATPGVVSEPERDEVRAAGSGYGQLDPVQNKKIDNSRQRA